MKKLHVFFAIIILITSPGLLFSQYGTVKGYMKVNSASPLLTGKILDAWCFGQSSEFLGDLNGDGYGDFAVGCTGDSAGAGFGTGAIYIFFGGPNGTILSTQKISAREGNFKDTLESNGWFGYEIANIGDFNHDGTTDIAVSAPNSSAGGISKGIVYLLFLNKNGTVKHSVKFIPLRGLLAGTVTDNARFGTGIDTIGDIDKDGHKDLMIGGNSYRIGGTGIGAAWVLFMSSDSTIKSYQIITNGKGGFTGTILSGGYFGNGVKCIGDFDKDGTNDVVIGERENDEGGTNKGSIYLLYLNINGTVKSYKKINALNGNFTGVLNTNDFFGSNIENLGDLNGDGTTDIAVCAPDLAANTGYGKVFILFLNPDFTVKSYVKIANGSGGFSGTIHSLDNFGFSASLVSDYNQDSCCDLLVTARWDSSGGGYQRGGLYILYLNSVLNSMMEYPEKSMEFTIYPNPAKEQFNIVLPEDHFKSENLVLNIYNELSQEVYTTPLDNKISTIDIPGLKTGVYIVNISNQKYSWSRKLIVNQ